jgi:DNA-binding HxlR family transcriptional regulator
MTKAIDSRCQAFQLAIDVLGRPWNALILNVLLAGPLRFSEFSERAEGPGDKVLSARLKNLEERGLVLRHVAHGPPVRVTYELSDKGRAFEQVAQAIERWGEKLVRDEKASPQSKSLREQGTRDRCGRSVRGDRARSRIGARQAHVLRSDVRGAVQKHHPVDSRV